MKKQVIAIIVAAVLALLAVGALVLYANNADDRALEGTETVEILQATEDIPVKTPVAELAETCPVPLLLAGGAKKGTLEEAYDLAEKSMKAGARGLVFGRNIFEAEDIAGEVRRYRKIVHGR